MVDLTDLVDSYEAYEAWAGEKEDGNRGRRLRDDFLDIARRFLQRGEEALLHWRGQTGIPVRASDGQVFVELACLDGDGTDWVRVH